MRMRKKAVHAIRSSCALALAALAPLAWADTATVTVSDLKVQVVDTDPTDNIWPWAVFFSGDSSWLAFTTTAGAHADGSPDQQNQGWLGTVQSASAGSGGLMAQASTTAGDIWGSTGPGATAAATATVDGQQSWAFANVFNGLFLTGAETKIIVTAKVDGISATGAGAQANTSIELCTTDGVCLPEGYSEAVAMGGVNGSAPQTLRAEWSNLSTTDGAWGTMNVSVAASALATPVPEPTTAGLLLAGLVGIGGVSMRRRRPA
jgi:hypothetical protein